MRNTSMMRGSYLLATFMCFSGCSGPERPGNVAADATWVESSKTGYWQRCQNTGNATHCTIWNVGGVVLLDEEFRPIDGGPTPTSEELGRLRNGGPRTGPYQVCLSDGRILLPNSRYDQLKDFIEGRRK